MTKYKLAPIEPTPTMIVKGKECVRSGDSTYDAIYKAMTAICPTVEEVDVEELYLPLPKERDNEFYRSAKSVNEWLYHLTTQGYRIIKETE